MTLDSPRVHAHRQPFEALEASVVALALKSPGDLHDDAVDALRYVIRFAKLGPVRNRHGQDVDVTALLAPHAWTVRHQLVRTSSTITRCGARCGSSRPW